jgi:hypothetical protein
MLKMKKRMLVAAMVLSLVAGFMVQNSIAVQNVMCLKQVQVGVTSNLPAGFWQTPQVGNLVKKEIGNVGSKRTLNCGYSVYNTTVFIMHPFPDGVKVCKPDVHGFVCN